MSKRKVRNQKVLLERNIECNNRLKLKQLKQQALALEEQIIYQKKENTKQLYIRNLKIFGSTCNFVLPFILVTSTVVTLSYVGGKGLPFYIDKIPKYQTYNINYKTNGIKDLKINYGDKNLYSEYDNTLILYTPWECQENLYIRLKKYFDIDKIEIPKLYNAILTEDYEYFIKNLNVCFEEQQTANRIIDVVNDYFIDAEMCLIDDSCFIEVDEDNKTNNINTIIEVGFSVILSSLVGCLRIRSYKEKIKEINKDYQEKIVSIDSYDQKLKDTNQKILKLVDKGKKNE